MASEKEEGRERDEREKNWGQGRRVEMTDWPASFKLERNSVEEDMFWVWLVLWNVKCGRESEEMVTNDDECKQMHEVSDLTSRRYAVYM